MFRPHPLTMPTTAAILKQAIELKYLTNHMGSTSHHTMSLVIDSLMNGNTHTQTCILSFTDKAILRKWMAAGTWFKIKCKIF